MNKDLHPLQEEFGVGEEIYKELKTIRDNYTTTWAECSRMSVSYIFPDKYLSDYNTGNNEPLPTSFQNVGTECVNSLSNKLLLTLLPPTSRFCRLLPDKEELARIQEKSSEPIDLEKIDTVLGQLENDLTEAVSSQRIRDRLLEAFKMLLVTGNSLIYKIENEGLKVFSPHQYVVERDFSGTITRIVIHEVMGRSTIPKEVLDLLEDEGKQDDIFLGDIDKDVNLYTYIYLKSPNVYGKFQEIEGIYIPDTEEDFKKDKLPYLALRWITVTNEDYGRGLVELYLADLKNINTLHKVLAKGIEISSKVVFGLVSGNPMALSAICNAENGQVLSNINFDRDVTQLSSNKANDFVVASQHVTNLENRVNKAFLNVGNQFRDSERTTATEIREVVKELESGLGGAYSMLAQDLLKPLLHLMLNELNPTAATIVTPVILTGLDAISRDKDLQNLTSFIQILSALGPEALTSTVSMPRFISSVATAIGITPTDIMKTQEEIQQEQQQAMAMQEAQMKTEHYNKMAEKAV